MKKIIRSFSWFYSFVQKQQDRYLTKVTKNYIDNYEINFKEAPSSKEIKRFRQDHILKIGLSWFVIGTVLFFFL